MASQPSQPPKAQIHILPFLVEKMEIRKEVFQKLREYQVTYSTCNSGHTYSKTSLSQNSERFENLKSTKSTTKSAYTYSVEKIKSRKQKIARDPKMSSQPGQPLKAHVYIRKKALQKFQEYQVTQSTSKSDHTYLETSLGQNCESLENSKSTKSTTKRDHTHIVK